VPPITVSRKIGTIVQGVEKKSWCGDRVTRRMSHEDVSYFVAKGSWCQIAHLLSLRSLHREGKGFRRPRPLLSVRFLRQTIIAFCITCLMRCPDEAIGKGDGGLTPHILPPIPPTAIQWRRRHLWRLNESLSHREGKERWGVAMFESGSLTATLHVPGANALVLPGTQGEGKFSPRGIIQA